MSTPRLLSGALLVSASALALHASAAAAADDAYLKAAKDYIATVSAPVTTWTGPTSGPKGQGRKLIVYVSTDQRNGGAQGASDGAQEAAKVLGWDFRILDGQGSVPARTSAMTQAIALKPDAIILGGVDAAEQAPVVEQAAQQGIKIVGWHAGPAPGKIEGQPNVFYNVTTDPLEVAKAAGLYAVADSNGAAGVILFTDSIYAIATAKTNAEKAAVQGCSGCKVLSVEDTPIGDGSVPAFQRIRQKQFQIATVAEPLHLQGWQLIDELNRAFAADKPSGYVPPVHLFVPANVEKDGGSNNIFDPGNGYKDQYKKIWGKS
jgi:ribose transport system substrate-binding protein